MQWKMNTTIDSVDVSQRPKFEITPQSISWITVFAITAVLSIAGNTVVILVFQARFPRKKCDTTLKPYLINLAMSDLIMAVFCMPFTFIDALSSWIFPETMCCLVLFFQVLAVSASVYTNVAIGLNRLRAILFPLRSFYTLRTYSWILVIIWLASFGMASVQLFVGQTVAYNTTIHCGEVWPTSQAARSYTLSIFALIYAIPLALLIGTYVTIGVSLWRNPRRDELLSKFKKFCHENAASLVHINGIPENEYIKQWLRKMKTASWWLGLSDTGIETIWEWVDDGTRTYYTGGMNHCDLSRDRRPSRLYENIGPSQSGQIGLLDNQTISTMRDVLNSQLTTIFIGMIFNVLIGGMLFVK